jgi:hypothetical protein
MADRLGKNVRQPGPEVLRELSEKAGEFLLGAGRDRVGAGLAVGRADVEPETVALGNRVDHKGET